MLLFVFALALAEMLDGLAWIWCGVQITFGKVVTALIIAGVWVVALMKVYGAPFMKAIGDWAVQAWQFREDIIFEGQEVIA